MNTSSGTEAAVELAEKYQASVLLGISHWVWVCPNNTRLGRVQSFFGQWDYLGSVQFQERKTSSVWVYTRIKYARIRLGKTTLEDPGFTRSDMPRSRLKPSKLHTPPQSQEEGPTKAKYSIGRGYASTMAPTTLGASPYA